MGDECRSIEGVINAKVAVFVRLVESSPQTAMEIARKTLDDRRFQEALAKLLKGQAEMLVQRQAEALAKDGQATPTLGLPTQLTPVTISGKDAEEIAKKIGTEGLKLFKTEAIKKLEETPEVKSLKKTGEELAAAFKCTTVGAWVDENKGVLKVVGAVFAVGGAVGMYLAKAGDPIAKMVEGEDFEFQLKPVTISGQVVRFEPSTQSIGASLKASLKTDPVTASLKIWGDFKGPEAKVGGEGTVVLSLGKQVSLTARGSAEYAGLRLDTWDRLAPPGHPAPGWRPTTYTAALGLKVKEGGFSFDLLAQVKDDKPSATAIGIYGWNNAAFRYGLGASVDATPDKVTGRTWLDVNGKLSNVPVTAKPAFQIDSHGVWQLTFSAGVLF
ncbi:MAG: hypothetical protein FJ255_09840 [Phycisphaerae bacterium]|nr:hypothetical protein [Phycisphaerae bacterium]